EDVEVADSLEGAIAIADSRGLDVSIAGGVEIYAEALKVADRMELTEVDSSPAGDVFFPEVDWSQWREVAREPHHGFSWVTYDRV
ncbi:MAG TPA: dihydrofolate reductase, partial [Acidimicrobiia bacterium]|nr:dihydrofolate reductase [Acidimicrobiia bacterium]